MHPEDAVLLERCDWLLYIESWFAWWLAFSRGLYGGDIHKEIWVDKAEDKKLLEGLLPNLLWEGG